MGMGGASGCTTAESNKRELEDPPRVVTIRGIAEDRMTGAEMTDRRKIRVLDIWHIVYMMLPN